MEEHPIPQQISAYQFKLVGDMTLKQFFQVAGGTLVSLLFYSSTLPGIVKWPLIILSFLFGIALAFFPLGDRPLSRWIFLFIKAIYSPTIYIWKKSETQTLIFQPEVHETTASAKIPGQTIPKTTGLPELEKLEKKESEFMSKVTRLAQEIMTSASFRLGAKPSQKIQPQEAAQKAGVQVQERSLEEGPLTFGSFEVRPIETQKIKSESPKFSLEAAPPTPATKPNVVVGQVVDSEGKIIEGAILEIRDIEGRAVRALKTNKLGHFMIVTPLVNGKYKIITEKEGLEFEPLEIEAKGTILPPIAIRAKRKGVDKRAETFKNV